MDKELLIAMYGDFGYANHRIPWQADHLMKVFCFSVLV